MKAILKISNKCPFEVWVDQDILEELSRYTWCLKYSYGKPYIQGWITLGATSKVKKQYLHRVIMAAKKSQIVDHIDGNALNNLRENLRFCTHQQNSQNKKPKNGRKYKGTYLYGGVYKVYLNKKYLGSRKTEEEAALLYNEAAIKEFGEFAMLNKVPNGGVNGS